MKPYPSDNEVSDALDKALRQGEAEALLFGWQDVALRVENLLMRSAYRGRENIKLATLLSWSDTLPPTYVTGLDLRPYDFGRASAQLLHEAITESGPSLRQRTHEPVLLEQRNAQASVSSE